MIGVAKKETRTRPRVRRGREFSLGANDQQQYLGDDQHKMISTRIWSWSAPDDQQMISRWSAPNDHHTMISCRWSSTDDQEQMMIITCGWNRKREAGMRRRRWSPKLLILISSIIFINMIRMILLTIIMIMITHTVDPFHCECEDNMKTSSSLNYWQNTHIGKTHILAKLTYWQNSPISPYKLAKNMKKISPQLIIGKTHILAKLIYWQK